MSPVRKQSGGGHCGEHVPALLRNRRQWLSWWDGKLRSLLFDIAVAVLAVNAGANVTHGPPVVVASVTVAAGVALALRRRFPWLAVAATGGLSLVTAQLVAGVIAVYTMARRRGPCKQLWIAGALVEGFFVLGGGLRGGQFEIVPVLVVTLFVVGSAGLLGLWIFQRKMLVVSYQERAEQAERERDLLAEREVAAERRRIAREMHDVVAHRVSVISLQAGALTMNAQDERTAEVAEVIRSTSGTALTELRTMLRVLRDDESGSPQQDGGELASDPTLGSIAPLVRQFTGSGANVRLEVPDPVPDTSAEVGRAAYRVVQEALTNAAKHAPHAAVLVSVAEEDEGLVVTVSNRRGRSTDTDAVPGSGYGLIGMRERVTLAGGTLSTGRTDSGGYRVRAIFPRNEAVVA